MRVLGRDTSGNVQKVLLLLEETDSAYTREDYGRQFENTAGAEYLAMNPTGKVPTLVDGDTTVWESHTILRYIAARAGSPLYPADPAARTRVECWMDWLLATLNGTYVNLFKASKGGGEMPAGDAAALADALGMLDRQLQGREFVAGEAYSLADIALAPIVHRCLNFPVELPALANVRRWHQTLAARAAFVKVIK